MRESDTDCLDFSPWPLAAPFAAPVKKTKIAFSLGHFQVGSYRYRSLIEGLYRSLVEALYTLNSPPVVSFN